MTGVHVIGPNLGDPKHTFHVHAAGCADVKKSKLYRWLIAFWALVNEPIVDQRLRHPSRALLRRARRTITTPDDGSVRVVTLRHITDPNRLPQDDYEYDPCFSRAL